MKTELVIYHDSTDEFSERDMSDFGPPYTYNLSPKSKERCIWLVQCGFRTDKIILILLLIILSEILNTGDKGQSDYSEAGLKC